MKVKLNTIEVKHNPRTNFYGIDELAQNIKELGLLQPLTVASKNGNGKYNLLDGQRRFMALQKLKQQEVDVILKDLNDQQQKEVPIATDFFKDKLKISEKAIGVANLINQEKKVTKQTLAKRYGWKQSEVEILLKLATLPSKILTLLDNGHLEIKKAIEITKVKREDIQITVAEIMGKGLGWTLLNALENVAYELPFDDVFTFEQAKKDNKIGIVIRDENYQSDRVFTYDKEYYEQRNREYEEREQKSYEERMAKINADCQERIPGQKEETKEEKKEKRNQAKDELNLNLIAFKEATIEFLNRKPSERNIAYLIERFIRHIGMDNGRTILKAFNIPFKASEMRSDDYRREVSKVLKGIIKNECSNLAMLIIYVDPGLTVKIYIFATRTLEFSMRTTYNKARKLMLTQTVLVVRNKSNEQRTAKSRRSLRGFPLGSIPSNSFLANQAHFQLLLLAYDLISWFKRLCLPPEWATATLPTLRRELFILPARLVQSGSKNQLKLPPK